MLNSYILEGLRYPAQIRFIANRGVAVAPKRNIELTLAVDAVQSVEAGSIEKDDASSCLCR